MSNYFGLEFRQGTQKSRFDESDDTIGETHRPSGDHTSTTIVDEGPKYSNPLTFCHFTIRDYSPSNTLLVPHGFFHFDPES